MSRDKETSNMSSQEDDGFWFSDWLSRAWPSVHKLIFHERWIEILSGIVTLIVGAVLFVVTLIRLDKPDKFIFYINDVGHIVLLLLTYLFFIPHLGAKRPPDSPEEKDINETVKRFKSWLFILVIFWLVFYVFLAIIDFGKAGFIEKLPADYEKLVSHISPLISHLNILTALAFFGLYSQTDSRWSAGSGIWLLLIIMVVISILTGIAQVTENKDLAMLAEILNGLIVGITTALLIGRIDSKYIGFRRATITTLYCYALIQPLYPYVFNMKQTNPLIIKSQYVFVAAALFMKTLLLLSLGKLIDTGRLHFYISSMRWLDNYAATLRAQYEKARATGSQKSGPCLFGLVPPNHRTAIIRIEQLDIHLELGILNAWIGVSWDIKELKASKVQISETDLQIKTLNLMRRGSIRVDDNNNIVRKMIDINLRVANPAELKEQLKKDPQISEALKNQKDKTKRVKVILHDLEAHISMLEDGELHYNWHRLESVDHRGHLFYIAYLNLEALK